MWAYYLSGKMHKERYGGSTPTFGNSFWFHPQIFRAIDERGVSRSQIFKVLDSKVTSVTTLKDALVSAYPARKTVIEQVFNRYSE